MNPYVTLGAVIILAISHGWVWVKGRGYEKQQWEVAVAKNTEKAKQAQDKLQGEHDEATKDLLKKLNGYRVFSDALIVSLSARPDRVSDTPRPDCAGATGAELSRRDGEFLAREATRANECRAALTACYADYDRARQTIIDFNKKVTSWD